MRESGAFMLFEAILHEVDQLQSVSTRLEALAEQYPPMTEPLITIAGNVRNTATVLAVLVVARGARPTLSRTESRPRAGRGINAESAPQNVT